LTFLVFLVDFLVVFLADFLVVFLADFLDSGLDLSFGCPATPLNRSLRKYSNQS